MIPGAIRAALQIVKGVGLTDHALNAIMAFTSVVVAAVHAACSRIILDTTHYFTIDAINAAMVLQAPASTVIRVPFQHLMMQLQTSLCLANLRESAF